MRATLRMGREHCEGLTLRMGREPVRRKTLWMGKEEHWGGPSGWKGSSGIGGDETDMTAAGNQWAPQGLRSQPQASLF